MTLREAINRRWAEMTLIERYLAKVHERITLRFYAQYPAELETLDITLTIGEEPLK